MNVRMRTVTLSATADNLPTTYSLSGSRESQRDSDPQYFMNRKIREFHLTLFLWTLLYQFQRKQLAGEAEEKHEESSSFRPDSEQITPRIKLQSIKQLHQHGWPGGLNIQKQSLINNF